MTCDRSLKIARHTFTGSALGSPPQSPPMEGSLYFRPPALCALPPAAVLTPFSPKNFPLTWDIPEAEPSPSHLPIPSPQHPLCRPRPDSYPRQACQCRVDAGGHPPRGGVGSLEESGCSAHLKQDTDAPSPSRQPGPALPGRGGCLDAVPPPKNVRGNPFFHQVFDTQIPCPVHSWTETSPPPSALIYLS